MIEEIITVCNSDDFLIVRIHPKGPNHPFQSVCLRLG